ncbi:MAG: carbohydrate kinase family protein [Candidatus Bathyarchaeia archaeon]
MFDFLDEVEGSLRKEIGEFNVVVMPDFFLDRFVSVEWRLEDFSLKMKNVFDRKGGSIDNVAQTEMRGGNAINTASALAALGIRVTPIVCTTRLGFELIRFYLKSKNVDLSHVKIFRKASVTTAIELKAEHGKVNVMLRDLGSLKNFGPKDLDSEDFEAIENADCICVFNWAGTRIFGTELANVVFKHAKTKGRGKTYCDTADPTPNRRKIPELVKNVLESKHLDILSLNENEAVCYAAEIEKGIKMSRKGLQMEELAKESAKILASNMHARVDLHTTSFSATFTKKNKPTIVSAYKVPVLRATGAGDAWNAGNIFGEALGLSDGARLALANMVAAYYISDREGRHPTKRQLIKFCQKIRRLTQ